MITFIVNHEPGHIQGAGYYWQTFTQGRAHDCTWTDAGPEHGPFHSLAGACAAAHEAIGPRAKYFDDLHDHESDPLHFTTI